MIAIVLHGNARTFFMPLREDPSLRICDLFHDNIVKPNNADLFVVTDTTDFYHGGTHYLDESQRGQARDGSSTMFHEVIDFINPEEARTLLAHELGVFFKDRLKSFRIQDPADVSMDPKFVQLSSLSSDDTTPPARTAKLKTALTSQYLKIHAAHGLLKEYENRSNVHYDLILRTRFDNMHGRLPLDVRSFDYANYDVFVPGFVDGLLVYDWCAFGTRRAMDLALSMYERLGFTWANRMYRCECKGCGHLSCGARLECACGGRMEYEEMTLSSEYHLYRLFKEHNIRYATSGYPMSPYRFR